MTWLIKFLFGFTAPMLKWLQPAFSGNDDKTSSRKLSSFVFMLLIVSTTSKLLLRDDISKYHVYILIILVTTFLLLIGILTIQNIVDILKNGKTLKNDKQP